MSDKDSDSSKLDISQLRTPIQISGKPIEQVLSSIHYGSPELRCLLLDECDLIFECKVCRALFRDLPNFIAHKRAYCTKSSTENRHVNIANLPEEKVVIIQPQAPEETEKAMPSSAQQPKPARPSLEETIMRIQSGELGRSQAYHVYTEAAEKLQRQKEGMKVAMIRTTPIAGNKNAVFIDVNVTSVNIHERQQQVSSGAISSYDQSRSEGSGSVIKRKSGERIGSTRHEHKSVRQDKHTSEPQKLLMDQLKEIQHKVKQKVAAAQDKVNHQKKVRIATQSNSACEKDSVLSPVKEVAQKTIASTNSLQARKKTTDNVGVRDTTVINVQSPKEVKYHASDDSDEEDVKYALVQHKIVSQIETRTSKENKSSIANAVRSRRKLARRSPICSKCNAIFATRKSLGFHMKIHHSPKRTFYPCPYCQSVFYYFFGITRHLSRNHSKSLEEINAMRKQLRDKSYTQSVGALAPKKETDYIFDRNRRTRSIRSSQLAGASSSVYTTRSMPLSGDKHQSKRTSGNNEATEPRTKSVSTKLTQANVSQGQDTSKLPVSGKIEGEPSKSSSVKEDMAESRTVKPKKQLKVVENAVKSVCDNIDTYSEASTPTPSPASSSAVSEEHQENTPNVCPSCQRSFGRVISYKNHLKVCKGDGDGVQKTAQTVNSGHKYRQVGLSASVDNILDVGKTKYLKGRASDVESEPSTDTAVKGLSLEHKNPRRATSGEKSISSEGFQTRSTQRVTTSAQRSSSVDRAIEDGRSRNRSATRSSAHKDGRDSSVDSTQSSKEGKSPRSHRNVLSRYATQSELSTSPTKFDNSLNTSINNDNSQIISNAENVLKAGEELSEGREKASDSSSDIEEIKPEVDSHEVINTSNINQNQNFSGNISESLFAGEIDKIDTGEPDKSLFLPAVSSVSSSSAKSDRTSQNLSPQKQSQPSTSRSSSQTRISLRSIKSVTLSAQDESSGNKSSNSTDNSVTGHRIKCEIKETETKESKPKSSVHSEKGEQMESTANKDHNTSDKLLQAEPITEQIDKKQDEMMQISCDSETTSFTAVKQTDSCSLTPNSEVLSEEQIKLESSSDSKNTHPEPQARQRLIVTSALSERPKRKRKVPSRNKDAEEMLSKIHSHNREVIPSKKVKTTSETKAKDVPIPKAEHMKKPVSHEHKNQNNEKERCNWNTGSAKESTDNDNALSWVDESFEDDDGENSNEESEKSKGRIVSNRTYVLEKCGSKGKRLKCYDQTKVYKMIDELNLKCLECGELCSQVSNLRRHVIRQHLKWSRYKCKLCKFESYDRSECTTHLIRRHRNRTINLRNVNQYIIDLVKQGSYVRSLKKNQTLKVKQQSESQEGNIYARPTIKKIPRLTQRAEDEQKIHPSETQPGQSSKSGSEKCNIQTKGTEGIQSCSFVDGKLSSSSHTTLPQQQPVMVTVPRKQQTSSLTSSAKVTTPSRKLHEQNQASAKAGLNPAIPGSSVSVKSSRNHLPFNISTRNSPRTFDTRPYNPSSNMLLETRKSASSKEAPPSQAGTRVVGRIISPLENRTKKPLPKSSSSQEHVVKVPHVATEVGSAADVHKSMTNSGKVVVQSMPVNLNSNSRDNPDCLTKSLSSNSKRLDAGSLQLQAPKVIEINLENSQNLQEVTAKPSQKAQCLTSSAELTSTEAVKSSVTSFIIRKPQQKLLAGSSELVTSGQLAILKLKEPVDQPRSPNSVTSSQQIVKTAATATRVPAPVTDIASLQGRQAQASVRVSTLEHVKTAQKPAGTSQPAAGSSSTTLPVTVARGSHIATTTPSSFILSHGQGGKFIIYTRPVGSKDLTAVSSLIKPTSVPASGPSASAIATVVKPPETNHKPSSETHDTVPEDIFPPGTIVLRKQYL